MLDADQPSDRGDDPPSSIVDIPEIPMPPSMPQRLHLGGPEAFEKYREIFACVFLCRSIPVVDPQGRIIVFDGDACRHICFREERFDKRRKRVEGEKRTREQWDQQRAEHILWIMPALIAPSLIVHNNQQQGNLAYLLGFPTGDFKRPRARYYVAVRPLNPQTTRVQFKTAYPIDQREWDNAVRGQRRDHVLYRCPSPRW